MGVGGYEVTTECGKRDDVENGGKFKPVRHPAIVAKSIDGEAMGAKRAVSFYIRARSNAFASVSLSIFKTPKMKVSQTFRES